jgi:hypothetical protein
MNHNDRTANTGMLGSGTENPGARPRFPAHHPAGRHDQ